MNTLLSSTARGSGVAVREGVLRNGNGGRFVATHGLTAQQAEFVRAFVANGGKRREAARAAGYRDFQHEGCRLLNVPRVRDAIRVEQERTIECEGASRALQTMLSLLECDSPQVRFQAARWLFEAAGHGLAAKGGTASTSREGKPLV